MIQFSEKCVVPYIKRYLGKFDTNIADREHLHILNIAIIISIVARHEKNTFMAKLNTTSHHHHPYLFPKPVSYICFVELEKDGSHIVYLSELFPPTTVTVKN